MTHESQSRGPEGEQQHGGQSHFVSLASVMSMVYVYGVFTLHINSQQGIAVSFQGLIC